MFKIIFFLVIDFKHALGLQMYDIIYDLCNTVQKHGYGVL